MSISTLGEGMGFVRWRSSRLLIVAAGLVLGACAQDVSYRSARDLAPIPPKTLALMSEKGMEADAPILMRSFKKESEIEVWKRGNAHRIRFRILDGHGKPESQLAKPHCDGIHIHAEQ